MNNINYCGKCGSKINSNDKYCGSCGSLITVHNLESLTEEHINEEIAYENEHIKDIDNYMDDREFRNLIFAILHRIGFENIKIVDERLVDNIESNDNDILAKMNDFTYLISTYLNTEITVEILNECFKDIEQNHATFGMLVTNTVVEDEVKIKAKEMNIEIIDRDKLMHLV